MGEFFGNLFLPFLNPFKKKPGCPLQFLPRNFGVRDFHFHPYCGKQCDNVVMRAKFID